VKIVELAKQLIRLSGFAESDIRIEYSGLRPGEKLYEEPLADAEKTLATPHPKLRVAQVRAPESTAPVEEMLAWISGPVAPSAAAVRAQLALWVPEYAPVAGRRASATLKAIPLQRKR
jgi:FlaA1/EpsC-like NDP-sugar epimerase